MARIKKAPTLTAEQLRLADRISDLYLRDEPLNISAVKRRHPKLFAAVMAITPYWGWRRAIEVAGLAYGDLRVELTDHVVCSVCGATLRNLGTHTSRAHGIDGETYKAEYPGADLACEEWRRIRATDQDASDPFALPHWEPIWTPEYVLDRIAERARLGHPLTSTWTETHDRNLMVQAFLKHPSWELALLAAGVDPEATRLARAVGDASDEQLLDDLRERCIEGLPLDEEHVRTTQPSFYAAIVGRFKTFAAGLHAAGIRPADVGARRDDDRRDLLLADARAVASLEGARFARGLRRFQLQWSGFALATFGSWRNVAEAAGVPLERLHKSLVERAYPDQASIVRELRRRFREGIPYHNAAVTGADGVRDHGLAHAAKRLFGSYQAALEAAADAGDDPEIFRQGFRPLRSRYVDADAVITELRRRDRDGLSLKSNDVIREDRALYDCAKRIFHAWHPAVRAAGLEPVGVEHSRGIAPRYPDAKSVTAEIRRRLRVGLPVNANGVKTGPAPDSALLIAARWFFDKWHDALIAAGVDPNAVTAST